MPSIELFEGLQSLRDLGETSVAVGSFDGVHLGHKSLIDSLVASARSAGRKSVVVTFSPHPRIALGRAEGLRLLSSESEKLALLGSLGVDAMVVVEFNSEFSALSYEAFVENILCKKLNMKELVVGFNHRLGHNHGGFDSLSILSAKLGFVATRAEEISLSENKISSTVVRRLLESGEVETANSLLLRPYIIIGISNERGVVAIDNEWKQIPAAGQYEAKVCGESSVVEIDQSGTICTQFASQSVEIEFIKRL